MDIIAGPCAWESRKQVERVIKFLCGECGIKYIRGGFKKYRSDASTFQGIGIYDGIEYMEDLKKKYDFKLVVEVFNEDDVNALHNFADVFQIGSRNAYNTCLLKATNDYKLPIIYKRHYAMSLKEFVMHTGYMNNEVIMCLRGDLSIHTKEQRFRSDMADIQRLKEYTRKKICYDVSHSSCKTKYIEKNTKAALVYEPHMLMIEVHPNPKRAFSDPKQQLDFKQFRKLLKEINKEE